MAERIYAPWTDEQVDALNKYQKSGKMHPFTCGKGCDLTATCAGWRCDHPDYMQDWAWEWMSDLNEFWNQPWPWEKHA